MATADPVRSIKAKIELITPAETSAMTGATKETLAIWRCTRRYPLPYVKIGRKVMYRLSDVEDFIRSRTVGGTAE